MLKIIVSSNPNANLESIKSMIEYIDKNKIESDVLLMLGNLSEYKRGKNINKSIRVINNILDRLVDLDIKVFYTLGDKDPQYEDILDDINLDASYLPLYRKIKIQSGFYLSSYPKFANTLTIVANQYLPVLSEKALFNIEGNGLVATFGGVNKRNYLNVGFLYRKLTDVDKDIFGLFFEIHILDNGSFKLRPHMLGEFTEVKNNVYHCWAPKDLQSDPQILVDPHMREKISRFLNTKFLTT